MDYSLLGNNVLKDHRWPTVAVFAKVGLEELMPRLFLGVAAP
jgi:hypothetical protein